MNWPTPEPGLVIRYSFLWHHEFKAGREDGKERPCALVLSDLPEGPRKPRRAVVVPITHSPPSDPNGAMEIPAIVKQRLGLDGERSWLILTETNLFNWPGPDMRPLRRGPTTVGAYGLLPPRFFDEVKRRFLAITASGGTRVVPRTE
jgi:hypothetical protein